MATCVVDNIYLCFPAVLPAASGAADPPDVADVIIVKNPAGSVNRTGIITGTGTADTTGGEPLATILLSCMILG